MRTKIVINSLHKFQANNHTSTVEQISARVSAKKSKIEDAIVISSTLESSKDAAPTEKQHETPKVSQESKVKMDISNSNTQKPRQPIDRDAQRSQIPQNNISANERNLARRKRTIKCWFL